MQPKSSRSRAPAVPAIDAGLRLLAQRAHSRAELWRKLARRGYGDDDVEGALARLAELGYLDDSAFAEAYVRRRSVSLGPLALSAELAARGVRRDLASLAIARLSQASQVGAAIHLVHRQVGRKDPASYKELLDTAGAKLLRRGFSRAVAQEACRMVWAGTAGTPHP